MKRKPGGLLLAIGAAFGLMAFHKQTPPPDFSSPTATVRSFMAALKNRDAGVIQQCIQGATDREFVKEVLGSASTLQVVSLNSLVDATGNTTNTARVAVEFTVQYPSGNSSHTAMGPVTLVDMFSLVKQGETWQLTPDPKFKYISDSLTNAAFGKMMEMRPVSFTIAMAASPELASSLQKARTKAQEVSCLSNTKQIALGTLMYAQDYDERTPPKKGSYTDFIYPYIKNRQVFTCPLDPNGKVSYTFNPGVQGIPQGAIASPAQTVMIYEGKGGKLDYRHDGRAAVGFMDGHCKMIGPDETDSLIWKVKISQAPVKANPTKKVLQRSRHELKRASQ